MRQNCQKREKSVMRSSKVSIKESLMGACTNFMYKLGTLGGIKSIPKVVIKQPEFGNNIVILGKKIQTRNEAEAVFKQIIWFTYRDKLKITEDLNSDVGWGCLPRVGQMLMAQSILKHYQSQGFKKDYKLINKIIGHFVDGQEPLTSQFSLSSILKYARWKFNIAPGQWFNIGQISDVLRKIQEQTPIQGTENLKILFFSQSVIFKSKIVQKSGFTPCKCENKQHFFCSNCHKNTLKQPFFKQQKLEPVSHLFQAHQKCTQSIPSTVNLVKRQDSSDSDHYQNLNSYYSDEIQIEAQKIHISGHQLKNKLLLIVSVRVSEKNISEKDFLTIKTLLQLKMSLGAMGGVPSKAIYIVGVQKEQVVYLDPHFVQQFVDKSQIEQKNNTFFCNNYRTLHRKSLDPSLAFCFYLKTIEEAQLLIDTIDKIKKQFHDNQNLFISVMDDDCFTEQIQMFRNSSPFDSSLEARGSFEYNSLQFRDIDDSY